MRFSGSNNSIEHTHLFKQSDACGRKLNSCNCAHCLVLVVDVGLHEWATVYIKVNELYTNM